MVQNMKKACLFAGLILMTVLIACGNQKQVAASTATVQTVLPNVHEEPSEYIGEQEQENAKMKIQIGDTVLTATLEDNETAAAFQKLIKNGGLSIGFSRYGGFEQVGSIGTSLPRNDVQMTTKAGDIVLYAGNQLVMFYGSNSWAYTRIGKFDSTKDLENILGKQAITATFTLK